MIYLLLPSPYYLLPNRVKTLRLTFKAISEDCDQTIRIIPVSARNIANREIQATGCEITITTNIPETQLLQSYPNPANQGCYIPFKLSADSNQLTVEIYNILGQKVRTIEIGQRKKGSYTRKDKAIFWDLRNDSGQNISSGLYFYKIKVEDFSSVKSMVVK